MALSVTVSSTRLLGITVNPNDMTKAFVSYTLLTASGEEIVIGRRSIVFQIDLENGTTIPSAQSLSNLIADDCSTRFGSTPDNVMVQGKNIVSARN